ncbi:MAG: hypothetical protein ACRDU8_07680 [Egibacteraceae bacterium]
MMGPANFGGDMLAGIDIPAPVVFGYIVTYLELLGGRSSSMFDQSSLEPCRSMASR